MSGVLVNRRNIPEFTGLSVAESGGCECTSALVGRNTRGFPLERGGTRDASYINHGHDVETAFWNYVGPTEAESSRGFSKFPKKPRYHRYHLDIELVVVHSFLHYFLRQFFQVKPRSRLQVFAASIIGPETTGCPRVENVLSSLRIRPLPRQELRRILFFFRITSSSMRDETNRTEQRDASKLLYCFRWQIVDNREINLENQVFR